MLTGPRWNSCGVALRAAWAPVLLILLPVIAGTDSLAENGLQKPKGVLTLSGDVGPHRLPEDRGLSGLYHKLLKLQTTASLLHITAHPDDEHGGILTKLSRGQGVRTALFTLNRGEAGANAVGPELFDELGLIRTEELAVSGRYYGIDDQYYSTAVDYGYSKRLDEAIEKWGREALLESAVRVIRMNRPIVVLSRFQGNPRDGHGQHQAAGLVALEAFEAAGDPNRFPEQIRDEGLHPWQPLRLFIGGVRNDEIAEVQIDAGRYSPWLGQSFQQFGWSGLSFQRSQVSGRRADAPGPIHFFYRQVGGNPIQSGASDFFDGLDTSLPGVFHLTREVPPPGSTTLLRGVEAELRRAMAVFNPEDPTATVPSLARALDRLRSIIPGFHEQPEAQFILQLKEQQLTHALHAAMDFDFRAIGVPPDAPQAAGGPFAAFRQPVTLGPVVPGQQFRVDVSVTKQTLIPFELLEIRLESSDGWPLPDPYRTPTKMLGNSSIRSYFPVTVPDDAPFSRPYFSRESIQENHYRLIEPSFSPLPWRRPHLTAVVVYRVEDVILEAREIVRTQEADLPYGHVWRELTVVPALSLTVRPAAHPLRFSQSGEQASFTIHVQVVNHVDGPIEGELRLELPRGWRSQPAAHSLRFSQGGEQASFSFALTPSSLPDGLYTVQAVASAAGREFREGYSTFRHRDLESRQLYRAARAQFRGVEVDFPQGLKVGYIMGVGDEVPEGIRLLGGEVQLLTESDLASADLQHFDAIVVGTRAYAVRRDLVTFNQRLLDYAHRGGNLIVLYQTQEFVPDRHAPFPAQLPPNAEEVSEEDSPVEILAPQHPLFQRPNRITAKDFEEWVEQRGSKFFTEWSEHYTPLLGSWDQGQHPQRGGWVTASYGRGHYTYCAYAFHRQLPYGVPGAYRLFANLLALGNAR